MKNIRSLSALLLLLVCSIAATAKKECPAIGAKKDGTPPPAKNQVLNKEKNRSTEPHETDIDAKVTIAKMLSSEDDPKAFDETKGATITGYMFSAKKEGGESCNCYAADDANHDVHVFIAPNKSVNSIAGCVVVEVTPWTKINHPDWTVQYLNSIKGHKVQVTGWLTFDFEHLNMSAANSNIADPKRGTVWEIHPVSDIVDMDGDGEEAAADNAATENEGDNATPTSGPVHRNNVNNTPPPAAVQKPCPKTPFNILCIILLGAFLGVTGQLIRVGVGLKKLNAGSDSKEDFDSQFDVKKLVVSILYAVIIGVGAGVLIAVQDLCTVWDKSTILAIIAAGYSGVDIIEGFVSNDLPGSQGGSTTASKAITGAPKDGGINQK